MSYKCEILADSLSAQGHRLTTFKLTYPRIIHSELMTHRVFSRNAASSRAIPVKKMIEYVRNNMFTPLAVQKAHKGMQGSDYFEGVELEQAKQLWIESAELALQQAEKMEKFGITKQLCNRLLEPFMYHTVLVTATEWENFFELRCPKYHKPYETIYYRSKKDLLNSLPDVDAKIIKKESTNIDWLQRNKGAAEIHIMDLAEKMWDVYNESEPKQLGEGEWHIPFGDNINEEILFDMLLNFPILDGEIASPVFDTDIIDAKIKVATARCARISYETLGDNPEINYEKDIKLHDDLLAMKHFSPFEHCCVVPSEQEYNEARKGNETGWFYNLKGFKQYREIIE